MYYVLSLRYFHAITIYDKLQWCSISAKLPLDERAIVHMTTV